MNKRVFLKYFLSVTALIFLPTFPSFSKSHKKKFKGKKRGNKKGKKKRDYFINSIYPNLKIDSPMHQAKYDKAIVREKDLLEKLKKIRNRKKSLAWTIHQTKYHPAMV